MPNTTLATQIQNRLTKLQQQLSPTEVWLIANPTDIQYLTGFVSLVPAEREALLFISATSAHLLYASFSPVTKLPFLSYFQGVYPEKIAEHVPSIVTTTQTTLLLDEAFLTVKELRVLETFCQNRGLKLAAITSSAIADLRMCKDAYELSLLKKAGRCAAQTWAELEPTIKPGQTEEQVRMMLEQLLLKHGSQQPAFPTIIAFGPHSALPHHQPTQTVLQENTAVLIDFGATIGGYRSDMTRTIWVGANPDPLFVKIEAIVKDAYTQTLDHAFNRATPSAENPSRPLQALDMDAAARQVITSAGYGPQFIHTTGHGVGLDIHEAPSLNWSNTTPLKPGFAITIEPGVYLEGAFGYRYENTILVSENSFEEITV